MVEAATLRARNPHGTRGPDPIMYIAMNRFQIAKGHEGDFETLWRERDSHLEGVPGFETFHLLKNPDPKTTSEGQEYTLYASHTVWKSEADFRAWTESESFKKAHAQARAPAGTYLGHPHFEGFEAILEK
jgi:heme-degrading monooxygenase HmoA